MQVRQALIKAAWVFVFFLRCLSPSEACVGPRSPGELAQAFWGPNSGYEKDTRPTMAARTNFTGAAPEEQIDMQLKVFRVRSVSMPLQIYEIEIFVRTVWTDPRLSYNKTSQGGCLGNKDAPEGEIGFDATHLPNIWTPGLYISNLDKEEKPTENAFWLYPSGLVWWSRRSTLQLSCTLDLQDLPYDTQVCPLHIEPFRDTSVLKLGFYGGKPADVQVSGGTVEWTLEMVSGRSMNAQELGALYGGAGLKWTFTFKRIAAYYEKYIIVPCILTVAVAWCSFFISHTVAPARVAMSLICFLSLSAMVNAVMNNLPRFGGDIWLLSFLAGSRYFVFYSILEYGAINLLDRVNERIEKQVKAIQAQAAQAQEMEASQPTQDMADVVGNTAEISRRTSQKMAIVKREGAYASMFINQEARMLVKPEQIELFSRIFYPVAYSIFVGALYAGRR